jgi:HK97 family phage major capsid protein
MRIPSMLYRSVTVETREPEAPLTVAISSETPVERYFGDEVLDHSARAIDMKRLQRGLPLCTDHDQTIQIGRVEEIALGKDGVLRGKVRFGAHPMAPQYEADMRSGIRPDISVGYAIDQLDLVSADGEDRTYKATRWRPLECSTVAVPADETVGVGRAADRADAEVEIPVTRSLKEVAMPEPEKTVEIREVVDHGPERKRVMELRQLADSHNMADAVGKWIETGVSTEQAMRETLATHQARLAAAGDIANKPPLTVKEEKDYSILRAMNYLTDVAEGRKPEHCFEAEVSDSLRVERDKATKGAYIPPRFAGTRGMIIPNMRSNLVVGTGTLGGNLRFTEEGDLIEQLRNYSIIGKLGARFLTGLQGQLLMPRQTAGGTAYWVAEAGTVTAGDIKWDTVTLSPKTLMYDYVASRQLLAQSAKDVEQAIRDDFVMSKSRELDRVFLIGTSTSNEPTGLVNVTGAVHPTVGTDGGAITWALTTAMEATAVIGNAVLDETAAYISNGKVANDMKNKFKGTAGFIPLWEGNLLDGSVNGYRGIISTTAPSNLTKGTSTTICSLLAFVASGREVMFGQWGGGGFAEMIVDPYSLKKTGLIEFTTFDLLDIQWRHGAGAVYINDLTTTL